MYKDHMYLIHICAHTQHMYLYIRTHMYTHVYAHMHIYIYQHAHMHKHT